VLAASESQLARRLEPVRQQLRGALALLGFFLGSER
jgi:hypothetical protein